jgi:glutaconate CoA-transferase subunit B
MMSALTDAPHWSADEMMTVAAARALRDGALCFVGIGLPSTAANLARRTRAPGLVLIYESGTLGAKPDHLPLSIGDGVLADTADSVVSVPEVFNYWLQPGRIDVGFLGAAQIDRYANINTTVIGDYANPKVRLPGAGGAPEIAASCREVIVVVRQNPRTFVDRVDFVTSVGYGSAPADRKRLGLRGGGPRTVITDLGVLEPDPVTSELTLTRLHPGVTLERVRAATGWPLAVAPDLRTTEAPTAEELAVLRHLEATRGGTEPQATRGGTEPQATRGGAGTAGSR